MKQSTFTDSDASASTQVQQNQNFSTLQKENPVRHGIPMPRHMVTQGQEGYRTPTIEDFELYQRESNQEGCPMDNQARESSRIYLPPHSPGFFGRYAHNVRILDQLNWNERIRHYTWVRKQNTSSRCICQRVFAYSCGPLHSWAAISCDIHRRHNYSRIRNADLGNKTFFTMTMATGNTIMRTTSGHSTYL